MLRRLLDVRHPHLDQFVLPWLCQSFFVVQNKTVPGTDINIGSAFESLLKDSKPVTGENVGRAVGRFIGDEVGAVTGLGLTGMLASSLGMQTEKDKKIKELESQLNKTY